MKYLLLNFKKKIIFVAKYIRQMKPKLILLSLLVMLLATSCFDLSSILNANIYLYGTEWSNEDEAQGLKFYDDDSVLFFWEFGREPGTFEYNLDEKYIKLNSVTVTTLGETSEFTGAQILEDGETMKLYWHKLGGKENYYMLLYKRR